MKLYQFLRIVDNYEALLDFLIFHRVIRDTIICLNCGSQLNLNRETLLFRCSSVSYKIINKKKRQKVYCGYKISAFIGTWFEHIRRGDLKKICRFIGYFVYHPPPHIERLMSELSISIQTAIDWSSFCREVFEFWVSQQNLQIGGSDHVVEIDEAKIGKRKYQKGRVVMGQWVFGGIDRQTKKIFIEPVPARNSKSLLAVIKRRIAPHSTIYSDCWKSYNCIGEAGFIHCTVNHKMNFVDPESGAHTQNIERVWRDLRTAIPKYGIRQKHYSAYIAEFLFKREHEYRNRIESFFQTIATMYPITATDYLNLS